MKKILRIALMLVLLVFLAFAVMLATNYKTMVTASAEEVVETPVEEPESTEVEESAEPEESTEVETPVEDPEESTEVEVPEVEVPEVETPEQSEEVETPEVETPEVPEGGDTDPETSVNDSKIALGDKIFNNLGLSSLVEKHGADKIAMSNVYVAVVLALIEGMLLARYVAKLKIKKGPVFKHKKYSKEFKAAARGKEVVQGKKHKIRF